jgi:ribonuclease VapC
MVVDTSAIVASLTNEPEALSFRAALKAADSCAMSAFTVLECRVVIGVRYGAAKLREFELLMAKLPIEVVAFDADQALLAHQAYRRFGKGTGHKAQLNLGDCAAYALARSLARPLLYKGGDFTETDIVSAMDMTKPMA